MSIYDELVFGEEANTIFNERKCEKRLEKISIEDKEKYLKKGYSIIQENKKTLKIGINKPSDEIFEDQIWCLFYKMGFTHFSKDRHFEFVYDEDNNLTKQLDVFCMDEDTVLIVECKSAKEYKKGNFKENLESYSGIIPKIRNILRRDYPNKDLAFIYATSNLDLGQEDIKRIKAFGFTYFDENVVDYYKRLAEHLGKASKYQLLANLFSKKKVKNMNEKVPAIEGNMGKYKYYVFCIEPERLLKISYVLHRNYANEDLMPTYQRLIVKKRLNEIRKFVNEGGYFPNSIIISIETKNPLVFDQAPKNMCDGQSTKVGVLHLPNIYQCAYIIDGQHRLYGYSETKYAKTNTIPVVAFVNMEQQEQLKLFMDINEHQKAVSKTLRNTLEVNLLWDSKDPSAKRRAMILQMWQLLGEKIKKSPFYNRIIVGENDANDKRYLTLENLRIAIGKTRFLNQYKKGGLIANGLMDFDDNDATCRYIGEIIDAYFDYFKSYVKDEWDLASKGIFSNNVIVALIQLLNDILLEKEKNETLNLKISSADDVMKKCEDYILEVCDYFTNISEDDEKSFKTSIGAGGPSAIWKKLRYIIHLKYNEFYPDGLQDYIDNECQDNNKETIDILTTIKPIIRKIFVKKLKNEYGEKYYLSTGIPSKTQAVLNQRKFEQEKIDNDKNITVQYDYLDFANFNDFHDISRCSSNWTKMFKEFLQNKDNYFNKEEILPKLSKFETSVNQGGNLSKKDFTELNMLKDKIEAYYNIINN